MWNVIKQRVGRCLPILFVLKAHLRDNNVHEYNRMAELTCKTLFLVAVKYVFKWRAF